MMSPLQILAGPVWERLTWTLLSFLWQGLVIAAAVAALLAILPLGRAQVRYVLLVCGLALMACCPLATFLVLEIPGARAVQGQPPESSRLIAEGGEHELAALSAMQSRAEPISSPSSQLPLPAPEARRPTAVAAAQSPEETDSRSVHRQYVVMLSPYCLLIWLAGVLAISARLLLSFIGVRVLLRSRRALPRELLACAGRLAKRLGMASVPDVFLSPRLREAIVTGLWRPVVLLPLAWAAEMPPDVLEAVIAHELAHICRWDLWVSLVQRLVEALLFYHPAVWWLSRRISLEREMCADELAVAATGQRITYARTLELLGRRRLGDPAPQFGAALGDRKMALLHRVRNVLGIVPSHRRLCWWPAGLLALSVPIAIWLASMSLSPPGIKTAQAAEETGGAQAAPVPAYRIEPLDVLQIQVIGTLIDQPIDGLYLVEPSGKVALGAAYGRAEVKDMTLEEAETAVREQLRKVLTLPFVQVTAAGHATKWRLGKSPKAPYQISPNDLLKIQVVGTLLDQPIDGDFVVEPTGTVALGPAYGRAQVKGLTVEEAEHAISEQLKKMLTQPFVSVTLAGWKSDSQDEISLESRAAKLERELQQAKGALEVLRSSQRRQSPPKEGTPPKVGTITPLVKPAKPGPSTFLPDTAGRRIGSPMPWWDGVPLDSENPQPDRWPIRSIYAEPIRWHGKPSGVRAGRVWPSPFHGDVVLPPDPLG